MPSPASTERPRQQGRTAGPRQAVSPRTLSFVEAVREATDQEMPTRVTSSPAAATRALPGATAKASSGIGPLRKWARRCSTYRTGSSSRTAAVRQPLAS